MTLPNGMRLGPYEVVNVLGAGGMGEVYRARDTRLGRDVAIKVLPPEFGVDPARLKRFEREARAASALTDPHIVAVYDIGTENGVSYIVTELVEGSDLRAVVDRGALSVRRTLDLAVQIADGLATAHEKGIVHRDLKPENILVTEKGLAKIADFGLAKLTDPVSGISQMPTAAGKSTQTGTIMGTVGYMSPEQASGRTVDFRSDQFSLGAILYEMATGRRAFHRSSPVLTLAAIIQEEPEPAGSINPTIPDPVRWVIDRCLSKEPHDRYSATRDLARELQSIREHRPEASTPVATFGPGLRTPRSVVTPQVEFRRLSFRRGTIESARFVSEDSAVVYGAAWNGQPVEPFLILSGDTESRPMGFARAEILAASSRGQLALSLRRKRVATLESSGILAVAPIGGGTPRELMEGVSLADWGPTGDELAVVYRNHGEERLEYPPGRLLYKSAGRISSPRVSPDGELLAFLDHPTQIYSSGSVVVVDRAGRLTRLSSGWMRAQGLAWRPDGEEIWFTAARSGYARALHAVSLVGEERLVLQGPASLTLHDISRHGRLLLGQDLVRREMCGLRVGAAAESELSWQDYSAPKGLSADGEYLLFHETGDGGGRNYSVYVWHLGESAPTRLGEGRALALSPDGRSALVMDESSDRLICLPTGIGSPRPLECGQLHQHGFASFSPDGARILFAAQENGELTRCYVLDLASQQVRAVTPPGTTLIMGESPIEPSGKRFATSSPERALTFYPIAGDSEPEPLRGALAGERVMAWNPEGDHAWVRQPAELPARVFRLDLRSGSRELWRELAPDDLAGVAAVDIVCMAPAARAYVYSYVRTLSDLYLVEGVG